MEHSTGQNTLAIVSHLHLTSNCDTGTLLRGELSGSTSTRNRLVRLTWLGLFRNPDGVILILFTWRWLIRGARCRLLGDAWLVLRSLLSWGRLVRLAWLGLLRNAWPQLPLDGSGCAGLPSVDGMRGASSLWWHLVLAAGSRTAALLLLQSCRLQDRILRAGAQTQETEE